MPIDLQQLGEVLVALFLGASTLLFTAAIAWRLSVKPTMRAILELRAARGEGNPQLLRRLEELEDEVRKLKSQLPALPEATGGVRPVSELSLRSSRERD